MTGIGEIGVLWRIWDTVSSTKLGKAIGRRFASKRNVLIIGSTGAGKSQFLASIDDIVAAAIPIEARTEFVVLKESIINGNTFVFHDVPGQRLHAARRSAAIKEAIQSRKKTLFINVVSFGYHEYGAARNEVVQGSSVNFDFIESNKRKEIDLLNEFANLLESETIITLITKADVWWDQREIALRHYQEGDYGLRLRHLFPNANHIVRQYSSINKRFYNIERVHDFDDEERKKLRLELFRLLCEAR